MFSSIVLLITAFFLICSQTHGARLQIRGTVSPPTIGTRKAVLGIKKPPRGRLGGHQKGPGNFKIFTPPPDQPSPNGALCQIWQQDCPDGYKCIPEDLTSKPRCRKIDDNPDQVGDSCSTKQDKDGDTCDIDGMCIDGVCRPLCSGNPGNPQCPSFDMSCHIYADGATICEEKCDPILHGICPGGQYCSIDSAASPNTNQIFTCMFEPDDPLGLEGDSCVFTSQCQQGFACMPKTSLKNGFCKNNAALSCCTRLAEDEKDCQPGDQLVPLYSAPPPGFEHLGVCVFVIF